MSQHSVADTEDQGGLVIKARKDPGPARERGSISKEERSKDIQELGSRPSTGVGQHFLGGALRRHREAFKVEGKEGIWSKQSCRRVGREKERGSEREKGSK